MPIYHRRYEFILDPDGKKRQVDPKTFIVRSGPAVYPATLGLLPEHIRIAGQREPLPEGAVGVALIDTGATQTCFDIAAAESAGLPIVGKGRMSSTTHDNQEMPLYAGLLQIPGYGDLAMYSAMGARLRDLGIVALIGRDALQDSIFIYNGIDGSFSLSR